MTADDGKGHVMDDGGRYRIYERKELRKNFQHQSNNALYCWPHRDPDLQTQDFKLRFSNKTSSN